MEDEVSDRTWGMREDRDEVSKQDMGDEARGQDMGYEVSGQGNGPGEKRKVFRAGKK